MLQSHNYIPCAAIASFVRRYYVFRAGLPSQMEIVDQLLSETAFIRLLVAGDWTAQLPDDSWCSFGLAPLIIGSNAQPMKVRVRGPFLVVGVSLRPGGWSGLFSQPASDLADRITPLAQLWGEPASRLYDEVVAAGEDDAAIIAVVEGMLLARLAAMGNPLPSPSMLAFEEMARNDCTLRVTDIADRLGLSVRQFERQCYAAFGHSPKTVLRRSRFLDMAQVMRGFGAPSSEHLAALRYTDQSHRNREFRHFFGMTPGAFEKAVTPLFTAGLKLRSEGLY